MKRKTWTLIAKSLVAGVLIQGFLLLLIFVAWTLSPEDDVIGDGLRSLIALFMPAIFVSMLSREGPDSPALMLTLCSLIDVLIYASMILGFLWWRQKKKDATESAMRVLKIT